MVVVRSTCVKAQGHLSEVIGFLPLRDPKLPRRSASALRAPKPIAQAPDLRVLLDAMLADQLIRRNLDFPSASCRLAGAPQFVT